ncbi:4-alpha-glucanotransferase [Flavihumibacter petaseus]|uniref:4-alpha-glucanotransferase n=1 Tax=Flavihumibacter petaseus NBRC 106054 TaxID=1220578 RepID=A0A0E9N6D6_9BACT|nr:4-alpha-glucanotransferase [Flavihumibacter petaseus]GAO45374.1 putative 4-alpha-glucanotransferase [Flavihumibacter petaseus NBRC 106054]
MKIQFYLRFHTKFGQTLQLISEPPITGDTAAPLQLTFLNNDYWTAAVEVDEKSIPGFHYKYQLTDTDGAIRQEGGDDRQVTFKSLPKGDLQLFDTWNHAGEFENAFYTAPFQDTLLPAHKHKKAKAPKHPTHIFRVKAPLLGKHEVLCVSGAGSALGDWDTDKVIPLHLDGHWWTVSLEIPREELPLPYKYGIYNTDDKSFTNFEGGENRYLFGGNEGSTSLLHDGFAQLPNNTWKGAGVAIPVFSLRSKNSLGVGEFSDLMLLADWAKATDLKLIQILPVNDTTATHSWTDSYPYAAISAFALHPIYINLEKVAGKKHADLVKPLAKQKKALNENPVLDYEQVMTLKWSVLRELFQAMAGEWSEEPEFQEFYTNNKHWLVPYAVFSYLRDKNNTSNFTQWKQHATYDAAAIQKFISPRLKHHEEIRFHYFVQYQLHKQLKEATAHAHKQGVIVKGDIPIGIYRYSCDAWVNPGLYNMDMQAGAPPDAFAVKGQNWGFPTYNWARMQEDGYSWWKQRFAQMSEYFDAFRIDHILGFFRIWSIPTTATEGIMGRFVPAVPVQRSEFGERHIWFDATRYTRPFITEQLLSETFGDAAARVSSHFLDSTGYGEFTFKPNFDTQQKISEWFSTIKADDPILEWKQGLLDLMANVILFEVAGSDGQQFHFRFGIEDTSSFQALEHNTQQALKDLYVDYFFRRQDQQWQKDAMQKLPALKASTNMLICGEDLGLVPHCVPEVMEQTGILRLEIQRMPKDPSQTFFHPASAPYLSVVTPSTHDMSTIRGWWEEDPQSIQQFYNTELSQWGQAPATCEPWLNKAIVLQHLHSPAMWAIFQLQDLFGSDGDLRVADPATERINVPAVAKHYWQYRMHLTLEALLKEKHFNHDLKEHIKAAGR